MTGQKEQNGQKTGAAGLNAYAKQKNRQTIETVNRVLDELNAQDAPVNFEIVAKLAGVSRGTLYNNQELCESCDSLREKNRRQEEKMHAMRRQIRSLEDEKKKLIVQLLDHEQLRRENDRLREVLRAVGYLDF